MGIEVIRVDIDKIKAIRREAKLQSQVVIKGPLRNLVIFPVILDGIQIGTFDDIRIINIEFPDMEIGNPSHQCPEPGRIITIPAVTALIILETEFELMIADIHSSGDIYGKLTIIKLAVSGLQRSGCSPKAVNISGALAIQQTASQLDLVGVHIIAHRLVFINLIV